MSDSSGSSPKSLGYAAAALQTVLAGVGFSFAKLATAEFPPAVLTLVRTAAAATGFLMIFFLRGGFGDWKPAKRDWLKMIFLAATGVTINQFLFIAGMTYTTPANGALLYATTPLFVLLLACFVLKEEKFNIKKLVGVGVALSGVLIVFFARGNAFDATRTFGNALLFVAVLSWATYLAYGKKVLHGRDAIQMTAVIIALGAAMFFPFGIYQTLTFDFAAVSAKAWMGVAFIVLMSSMLAYTLLFFALKVIMPSKVSIFMNAQPVVATLVSVAFMGEQLSAEFVVGGVLTIIGILITQFA